MESESIAALLGGMYVALCAGLSDEGIAAANDILFYLAGRPTINPEEARIFRLIAESATIRESDRRPALRLIEGGASRSNVVWSAV
jgi:hypothetical protein